MRKWERFLRHEEGFTTQVGGKPSESTEVPDLFESEQRPPLRGCSPLRDVKGQASQEPVLRVPAAASNIQRTGVGIRLAGCVSPNKARSLGEPPVLDQRNGSVTSIS